MPAVLDTDAASDVPTYISAVSRGTLCMCLWTLRLKRSTHHCGRVQIVQRSALEAIRHELKQAGTDPQD